MSGLELIELDPILPLDRGLIDLLYLETRLEDESYNRCASFNNDAILYSKQRLFDDALSNFNKSIAILPNEPEPHYNKARTLLALGALGEARKEIRRAVILRPTSAMYHSDEGVILSLLGLSENAIKSFQIAIKLDAKYIDAYTNLGLEFDASKRHKLAIECWHKAIELSPSNPYIYELLSSSLASEGDFDGSISALIKYAAINISIKLFNQGVVIFNKGLQRESLVFFKQASLANPTDVLMKEHLGFRLTETDFIPEAIATFIEAASLGSTKSLSALGEIIESFERPRYDKNKYDQPYPANVDVFFKKGTNLAEEGNYLESIDNFDSGFLNEMNFLLWYAENYDIRKIRNTIYFQTVSIYTNARIVGAMGLPLSPEELRVFDLGIDNKQSGQKEEGDVSNEIKTRDQLAEFISRSVGESDFIEFRRLYERLKLRDLKSSGKLPMFADANLSADLCNLSAPAFLKKVYGDFLFDGVVDTLAIREFDPGLMASVDQYISTRVRRGQNLGDAEGLVISTSRKPILPNQKPRKGEIAGAKAETTAHIQPPPKLSEASPKPPLEFTPAELAAFKAHAAAHPWRGRESKLNAPSFIAENYTSWLERGFPLELLRNSDDPASRKLAGAYSTAISRDPSKAIKGLYVAPHTAPDSASRPIYSGRRVNDLTDEQRAARRAIGKAAQARYVAKKLM